MRPLRGGLTLAGGWVFGKLLAVLFLVGWRGCGQEEGFCGIVCPGTESRAVKEEVALEGFGVWIGRGVSSVLKKNEG